MGKAVPLEVAALAHTCTSPFVGFNVGLSSLSLLSSHPHAVLAELQQVVLITSEECKWLDHPSDVLRIQSGKSPEVQSKTADVLRRHGLGNESTLLAGKQTQPLIHVPVLCCTVEPSCTGHLNASIVIVSFMHIMLGDIMSAFPLSHLKRLHSLTNSHR